MEVTREQSTPNFLKNRHFLPHDTQSFFTLHLTLHDEGPYHIKTSPLMHQVQNSNKLMFFKLVCAAGK